MKTKFTKQNHGFTIIEVMIVLAIAGLILAIVFLAVPALQRNARNNSRRNDVSHLVGLINEYEANHTGQLPTGFCTTAGNSSVPACPSPNPNFVDITSENWAIENSPTNNAPTTIVNTGGLPANIKAGTLNTMVVDENALCSNGSTTTVGASNHTFDIDFAVETSGNSQDTCVAG